MVDVLKNTFEKKLWLVVTYVVDIVIDLFSSVLFQLFTEYGRLAMEETFLKPFQVLSNTLLTEYKCLYFTFKHCHYSSIYSEQLEVCYVR